MSPRNAAARIADVEHRVTVQRAWRRTEAVASLMAATVAVLVVVAALPTTPRRQADTLPQLNMIDPPPALVGYQLPATLHVKGKVYGYFRSQESAPGQPSLLVAVASAPQQQVLTWVSPPALTGWIVVSVDGGRWSRATPRAGSTAACCCHRDSRTSSRCGPPAPTCRCGWASPCTSGLSGRCDPTA